MERFLRSLKGQRFGGFCSGSGLGPAVPGGHICGGSMVSAEALRSPGPTLATERAAAETSQSLSWAARLTEPWPRSRSQGKGSLLL